jgi:hypothetical protein
MIKVLLTRIILIRIDLIIKTNKEILLNIKLNNYLILYFCIASMKLFAFESATTF